MGTISVEYGSNLYWLGRYAERTYTTLNTFFEYYDKTLDKDKNSYKEFLESLEIDDKYSDNRHFIRGFLYDKDSFCVMSTLRFAHDNALVCRNVIGSEALAYIQLAMDAFSSSRDAKNLRLALMPVIDYLLAFWGSLDDKLANGEERTIIKCGKFIERLDLYFRFSYNHKLIKNEYEMLCHILARVREGLCNTQHLAVLTDALATENYKARLKEVLESLNKIFEEQVS
ncbi:MAG: alpha-E domain-containing protein [Fibromonadaceae bacterium]|jgi:uncharacterized alpha-E superfamily protein|nr:alpha-E domain-containing protein [Fibromonadaceae bacterium]